MQTPSDRLKARVLEFRDESRPGGGMTWAAIAEMCGLPATKYVTIQNIVAKSTIPVEIIPISYGLGMTPDEVWFGVVETPEERDFLKRLKANTVLYRAAIAGLAAATPPQFQEPYKKPQWDQWMSELPEDMGVCYMDDGLEFIFINQQLADINGYSVDEHCGQTLGDLLPSVAAAAAVTLNQVMETQMPVIEGSIHAETNSQPGIKRIFTHRYDPVIKAGSSIGVTCVLRESPPLK